VREIEPPPFFIGSEGHIAPAPARARAAATAAVDAHGRRRV
jgi:hypothetical protein